MKISRRIKNIKFEASYFWLRIDPPVNSLNYCEHKECYQRLNDIFFEMPGILEAFGYAKEEIRNPSDESWKKVLEERMIPYSILEWEKPYSNDIDYYGKSNEEQPIPDFFCSSKPFLNNKYEKWIIKIRIRPEKHLPKVLDKY